MIENINVSLVDWSRAQFALTAMYHWIFVPLTLGITFIMAIMESIYLKTGNPEWKKITKFWMKLFGINFAIGVATGIILEFEFGTNWSNYSWFVGDIFGAPLAIEGIMAFFLETTFIAVMFFGWEKVGKGFHLLSTWLVAIGSNLSALWILVANGWMQDPRGMEFNPVTARNEMVNFLDVALSPTAINKFLHTLYSSYLLSAVFVIGVASWYLLKKREVVLARKSILVAAIFGLLTSLFTISTGDGSARRIAKVQPMKLASLEGLYHGREHANLIAWGFMSNKPVDMDKQEQKDFYYKIEIPGFLSYLAYADWNAFVPGIHDLLQGNSKYGLMSVKEKTERGRYAIGKLKAYKDAVDRKDNVVAETLKSEFLSKNFKENYFKYFGYGYITNPDKLIPNIPLMFYSFHIMVVLGFYFLLFFILIIYLILRKKTIENKWILRIAIWSIPLAYVASQCGWIVAEVGRQPWVIQDLMPAMIAVSHISTGAVQVTFWLFVVIFTTLLIAELKIMFKQIEVGPKEDGGPKNV
ncbi:MAG: cytochrome ubiquinol oxidase subunit I [Bacteroidota bacterium]|nr:cytochrome ubiquinol oxidase subunit I [Bacteroidota bacterium]